MYVYVIKSHGDRPTVKIGKSGSVAERLARLQRATPRRLELLGWVRCHSEPKSRQVEKQAHTDLAVHAIGGEWFNLTPEVQAYVDKLLATPIKYRRQKAKEKKPDGPVAVPRLSAKDLEGTLPIPEAAAKYGLDVKKLRGRIYQRPNGIFDPMGSLEYDVVYDGWRLAKLADDPSIRSRDAAQPDGSRHA